MALLLSVVVGQGHDSFFRQGQGFSEVGVMSLSSRSRRLFVAPLAGVERQGRGSLGSGSLAVGISDSLLSDSYFIQGTHPFPAYSPDSIRGKALEGEVRSLLDKGAVELAPLPSPGYFSR